MTALTGEVSVRSRAPAAVIWSLLSDVTGMGRWSPECIGASWLDGATVAVPSASFRGRNRIGPLHWTTRCTILAVDPGRFLAFDACHWSGAVTRWTFELSTHGLDTTVRQTFRTINSPAIVLCIDRLLCRPRALRSAMRTTLERLSAEAEQHCAAKDVEFLIHQRRVLPGGQ
jgi:hypothetical protein